MTKPTFNVLPHVESYYSTATGKWTDGVVVENPNLVVSGLSPALNYGQQAFEGMKAFRGQNGEVLLYRGHDHACRMNYSSSFVSIPVIPQDHFVRCIQQAVMHNIGKLPPYGSGSFLYVRPLVIGSGAQFAPVPSDEYIFSVFVAPLSAYLGDKPLDAMVEENIDHAASIGTGSAKIGGNYAPLMKWADRAKRKGYPLSLFLDSKTRSEIEEFSTSGFLGIKEEDGQYTIVSTDSSCVIPSITANSCLAIAKSLGWNVEVRPISYSELATFDEVIAAGTAASLVPIRSITRESASETITYLFDDQTIGVGTAALKAVLAGIQQGVLEDTFGWMDRLDKKIEIKSDKFAVNEPAISCDL